MALTECSDCRQQISTYAKSCPSCGWVPADYSNKPKAKTKSNADKLIETVLQLFWAAVGLAAILLAMYVGLTAIGPFFNANNGIQESFATNRLMLAALLLLVGQMSSSLVRQMLD